MPQSFNLTARDDLIPELLELHNITLTRAVFNDEEEEEDEGGATEKSSSSVHGAASVDQLNSWTSVIIKENNNPYGVLQVREGLKKGVKRC